MPKHSRIFVNFKKWCMCLKRLSDSDEILLADDFKPCFVELLCLPYYKGKSPSWQGVPRLWLGNCFEKQLHSFNVKAFFLFVCLFSCGVLSILSDSQECSIFWQLGLLLCGRSRGILANASLYSLSRAWVYLWFPWRNFTRLLQGILPSPCNLVESQGELCSWAECTGSYFASHTSQQEYSWEEYCPSAECGSVSQLLHCAADSNWGSGSAMQSI